MAMPPLRTAQMCGSCHRAFLSPETGNPAHLVGQDELGAWQRSAYAGSHAARVDEPIEQAECRTCHMPLEAAPLGDSAAQDGKLRSHRFAGGNTWLAAMRGRRRPGRSRAGHAARRGEHRHRRRRGRRRHADPAGRWCARDAGPFPHVRRRGEKRARGAPVPRRRGRRAGHVGRARGPRRQGRRLAQAGADAGGLGRRSGRPPAAGRPGGRARRAAAAARDAAVPDGRGRPHARDRATPSVVRYRFDAPVGPRVLASCLCG